MDNTLIYYIPQPYIKTLLGNIMRLKAVISYDGTSFEGFQRQKRTHNTVSGEIERKLESLGINSLITGSGRTDAGVHATGQVIHFDLPQYWSNRPLKMLQSHINGKLDKIYFKHISSVTDNFHARFNAKIRIYRYIFKHNTPSPFEKAYIAHMPVNNLEKLQKALSMFEGIHDFRYFHKSGSDIHSSRREIFNAYLKTYGPYGIIYFHANGYLRAQVRMMIDTAVKVSNGTLTFKQLSEQLEGKACHNRALAKPQGLYLARVIY